MTSYVSEAQRRIETGWRIEYVPELWAERPWAVLHKSVFRYRGKMITIRSRTVQWCATSSEARAAYLAVTARATAARRRPRFTRL